MNRFRFDALFQNGLIWVVIFVVLDSAQAVFFGNRLQQFDAFLIGALVFGAAALFVLILVWFTDGHQFAIASQNLPKLCGMNISVAGAWVAYLYAIQMIEPAVAFTLMSVMLPTTNIIAARLGMSKAETLRNRPEWLGLMVMIAACMGLIYVTLDGQSGFVRGDTLSALWGIGLSLLSGILFALMLLFGKQLDEKGIKPLSQFGLRFVLYVIVASIGAIFGLDDKGSADFDDLLVVFLIGLILLALPIYVVQKAVSLAKPMSLSALASTAPLVVFLFQLFDGRVDYASATLVGLIVYFSGALFIAVGVTLFERQAGK